MTSMARSPQEGKSAWRGGLAARLVIFLDDGGVMNESRRRTLQWQRLVGEFFAPLLGGTPEAWREANRLVIERLLDLERWRMRIRASSDYTSFESSYQLDWPRGMCEGVGIAAPVEGECLELVRRAEAYIIPHVRAAFPGVVDIRILHRQGYTLHTASGESSLHLAGYLDGMGVRACFGRLYGPDLINTFKEGPQFYERIFADSGITPAEALVVDDSSYAIAWAAQTGAHTLLVAEEASAEAKAGLRISCLAQLPQILQQWN